MAIAERENWREKFLVLSWYEYQDNIFKLSQQIAQSSEKFDVIVGIARGGLGITSIMSDFLKLSVVATFTAKSYQDMMQQQTLEITFGLGTSMANKRILLVDDVSDSGKTFKEGRQHLIEMGAHHEDIRTAAIHVKPHSTFKPNYFCEETTAWVVYPYEVHETIETLEPIWAKDGVSHAEMRNRFVSFGFKEEWVDTFLSPTG